MVKKILFLSFLFGFSCSVNAENYYMNCSGDGELFDITVDPLTPFISMSAGIAGCIGDKVRIRCEKTDTEITCFCEGGDIYSKSMISISRISGQLNVFKVLDPSLQKKNKENYREYSYSCRLAKKMF